MHLFIRLYFTPRLSSEQVPTSFFDTTEVQMDRNPPNQSMYPVRNPLLVWHEADEGHGEEWPLVITASQPASQPTRAAPSKPFIDLVSNALPAPCSQFSFLQSVWNPLSFSIIAVRRSDERDSSVSTSFTLSFTSLEPWLPPSRSLNRTQRLRTETNHLFCRKIGL